MPAVADETRAALSGLPEGDLAAAAAALDALVARHPGVGAVYANRATLAMLQGETETAMTLLQAAAAHGFTGLAALAADPLFAPLAGDPRLAALLAAAPVPVPAPVADGTARVDAGNTAWNPATERLEPRFAFPDKTDARVLPRGEGPAAQNILAELWRLGRAAGNWGDLYDNRDRGHSRLDPAAHPQLTPVDLRRRRPRRRPRLRPQRGAELRPPDLRQFLHRHHRRRALAQPAALRDDPGRRHRPAAALAERRDKPALRLSLAQGLRRQDRRPLPGQHPLSPGLARLLGLRQALPRRHRADPRRLPPRHQGAAGRPRT